MVKSEARARSRPPERTSGTRSAPASSAESGPRLNISASSAPARIAPKSAKKMRNLVLSHSHGARMTMHGTANHSHSGKNHFANGMAIRFRNTCAARIKGISTDVFLIQNQMKSGTNQTAPPSRVQSEYDIQPGCRQNGMVLVRSMQRLLAGGHSHASTGTPRTSAGTKKYHHSRRRLNSAQNALSATIVPYAWTWKAGVRPATTPAKRNARVPSRSRTATHTS